MSEYDNKYQPSPAVPPPPPPSYAAPPAPPEKPKRSLFKRILRSIFISLFVLSLIINLYLLALLGQRFTEQEFRKGDPLQKIALIDLKGQIDMQTAAEMRSLFKRAQEDKNVQAIILVVNCPGGQVAPSNMINRYIRDYQADTGKKVYVSIQQLGASGAYWISAAADKIYAQTNAIVGSIGVIYMGFVAETALKEKLGIDPLIIKSSRSPYKDRGPPFRHPDDEERARIQLDLDTYHQRFVDVVSAGRDFTEEETWLLADGDVHDGPTALEKKLIDAIGFLEDVIDDLAADAGLEDPHVVRYLTPPSLREILLAQRQSTDPLSQVQTQLEEWMTRPKIVALWPGY